MHLLDPAPRRPPGLRRAIGASPIGILAAWLLSIAFAAVLAIVARNVLSEIHGLVRVLAIPVLLVCGTGLLLVIAAFGGAFRASLRDSNWVLGVDANGIFLNLRSFMNARSGDGGSPVAFVPFCEIAAARKVTERWDLDRYGESSTRLHVFLELDLPGVDTAPLAEAIRLESARPAPERSFLGVRVRAKVLDRPVFVESPGVVRVQWKRGMLAALEGRVRIEPSRSVRRGADATSVLDLARRGDRIGAITAAREGAARQGSVKSLAEARKLVEEFERRG